MAREDDINMDGSGILTSLEQLGSRSTGPVEPNRTPSNYDPVDLNQNVTATSNDADDLTDNIEWQQFVREWTRTRGGGFGGGGGGGGRNTGTANPYGMGAQILEALRNGQLVINEDGTLAPGPNFNNDPVLVGIMERVNAGIRAAAEQDDSGSDSDSDADSDSDSDADADADDEDEETRDIFQEILDEAEATGEEITEEGIATARDIANEIGRAVSNAVPKDLDELKDLIKKIISSTSGVSKDCVTWTENVGDGTLAGTYPGWKDCVNLGIILSIPGLPGIPLPPGMVDLTWKEFEDLIKEAGQDIRDVLEDPAGWLEETLEEAREKVRGILADIRGGISDRTLGDLIDGAVGGYIGGLIYSEIEEEIEANNPFLNLSEEDSCANGATNFPECTECPEGFQYFEGTKECQPIKQAPIETTPEDCEDQVFADQNPDLCGDSLEGGQDDRNEECKNELATESAYYDTELGRCVVPIEDSEDEDEEPEDEEPEFGYCEDGKTPKENREGTNCPEYEPPGPEFGYCEDGTTEKTDTEGSNCPENQVVDFGLCEDGVTPKEDEEGSNCPQSSVVPDFGLCEDGVTPKQDEQGSNCPEIPQAPDFGMCDDGVTPKEDEQGSNCPDIITPIDFGMCDDGVTQKQDEEGSNCPDVITPIDFGLCEDGVTQKQDEAGSNCPDIIETPSFGLCDDGVTEKQDEEGSNCPDIIEEPSEEEECPNGAVDWPLCSECADGSRPDPDLGCQAPEEECPEGTTRDPETGECLPSGVEEPPVDGAGGGGGGGSMFTPFMAGLNYQLPEIQPLILPQRANDMMGGLLTKLIVDRTKK